MATASEITVPVKLTIADYEARRLTLAPGDVIVITGDRLLDGDTAERIQAVCDDVFPDNKTIVLAQDIRLDVVTPEHAEPDPGPIATGEED